MRKYELAGRTVAITGSTGGLGSRLAESARRRGANLVLLDIDAEAVAAQASALGGDTVASGHSVDVRDAGSVQRAIDAGADHFGRLDVVIANAGITDVSPIATTNPATFERVIDINLNGVMRTFRAAIPHVQKHGGYLLAVSSMAAFIHSPLQGAYTASKAGVWALCDSTRLEMRYLGVGVGSLHPTFFRTSLMDNMLDDPAGRSLWGGNSGGIWKMVSIDEVVDAALSGIERRAETIVVPSSNRLPAAAPGLFRALVERLGFTDHGIRTSVEAAAQRR
ncbi:SDR family NAD(P)-dependent oxidoreductase [Microbacterium sp. C23T]